MVHGLHLGSCEQRTQALVPCPSTAHPCRGSYLYFTGSRAFHQVMNTKHTFLHRRVCCGGRALAGWEWQGVDQLKVTLQLACRGGVLPRHLG